MITEMTIQYYLSAVMFVFFIAMVISRAIVMHRKGINALLFGKTDKSDFLLIPIVLILIYTIISRVFNLPMWKPLIRPFWNTHIPGWVGVIICIVAVYGIAYSLVSFGNSFRVGIDENNPDRLVTTGIFAFSRNPIYVCFIMFFLGLKIDVLNFLVL